MNRPGGHKPGGHKPGGRKRSGPQAGWHKPGGHKPGGSKPGQSKPGGNNPRGSKPGGPKQAGARPGAHHPGEHNPSGSPAPHQRRQRYRGTHPQRFEERYKEHDADAYPEIVDQVRARGGTPAGTHVPIMVPQVMATLAPKPGERVADCTLGYGGHALEFLGHVGPTGHVHGFDVDGRQLQTVRGRLGIAHPNLHFHRSNFAGLGKVLATEGLDGFDVIFADLGVSSMQIDEPGRGFSYKHDGPLDMRMDERIGRTAADLLATMGAAELSTALAGLADEPRHERIAQAIVQTRTREPILRTGQLVRVIFEAVGLTKAGWKAQRGPTRELHPAARTFQALRILVNDELGSLRHLLRIAPSCLRPGGRIGILSFHSGEHDLVQNAFDGGLSEGLYEATCPEPLRPSPQERFDNPRSSAARLRWAKRPAS